MGAVNSERIGGIDTFVLHKVQTAYTTSVTPDTLFGGLVKSANFTTDRQYTEKSGFKGNQAEDGRVTAQQLAGTVVTGGTIEFDAQRWDWLEYLLLKDRSGSGTTESPYVYGVGNTAKYLTVSEEIENEATDSHRVYGGMVINNASISCSVGEAVNVNLSLLGGRLSKTAVLGTKVAQYTDEVYNFSGGSITFPDTTEFNNIIDSITIDVSNNYTVIYGFNEEAQNARAGKLNLNIKLTTKYLDDTNMEQFLGSATDISGQTVVDLTIKFDKGTDKYIEFTFKDVVITKSDTQHTLNEFVVEDLEILPRNLEVKEVV